MSSIRRKFSLINMILLLFLYTLKASKFKIHLFFSSFFELLSNIYQYLSFISKIKFMDNSNSSPRQNEIVESMFKSLNSYTNELQQGSKMIFYSIFTNLYLYANCRIGNSQSKSFGSNSNRTNL